MKKDYIAVRHAISNASYEFCSAIRCLKLYNQYFTFSVKKYISSSQIIEI